MSKVLPLLILLLLAVSCGGKKETSAVKLKLFQGSITTGTTMDGGILVMGRSEDGLNSFRTSLASSSDSLSVDLAKGRWEFAAVAWTNVNGPMTGENRCAYTGFVDLKDPDVNVSFDLTQIRCTSDFNGNQFSDSAYQTAAGKFLEFFPVLCNENLIGNAGCYSAANPTSLISYKVIYKSESKGLVTGSFSTLSSNCLTMTAPPRVRIPLTSEVNGSPLNVTTAFYKNATCNGNPDVSYDFKDGIIGNSLPIWNQAAPLTGYYSYFYINPGVMYDMSPVNPTGLTLMGPIVNTIPTFNMNGISYTTSTIPSNVAEVCFTQESSCPAGKWLPVSTLTGNIFLDNGIPDGSYTMRLFYKTFTGAVSTTPMTAQFNLDFTAPAPIGGITTPTISVMNGLYVTWTAVDDSAFLHNEVQICSDINCSSIVASTILGASNIKSAQIPTVNIPGGITVTQTYCVRVVTFDVFNRREQVLQFA